jgi:hypothetical protein
MFPDMDPEERNRIFNRFAHIVPIDEDRPRLLAVAEVGVPWAKLGDPLVGAVVRRPLAEGWPASATGGHVDTRVVTNGRLQVVGWAPWSGLADDQRLTVYADPSLEPIRFARVPRPDVAKALGDPSVAYSGFEIVFAPAAGKSVDLTAPLCLLATGTSMGPSVLIADNAGSCGRGPRPPNEAR